MTSTKIFFRISLLTIIFVSIPIFAIIFEEPEKYPPMMTAEEMRQVGDYKKLTIDSKKHHAEEHLATRAAADKLNRIQFTKISDFIYKAHQTDINIIRNKDKILEKAKKIYQKQYTTDTLLSQIDELLNHFIPSLADLAKERGTLVLEKIIKPLIQRKILLQKLKMEPDYDKLVKKPKGEMAQKYVNKIKQLTKDINSAIKEAISLDQQLVSYADAVIMPDIFGRQDYFKDFYPGLSEEIWINVVFDLSKMNQVNSQYETKFEQWRFDLTASELGLKPDELVETANKLAELIYKASELELLTPKPGYPKSGVGEYIIVPKGGILSRAIKLASNDNDNNKIINELVELRSVLTKYAISMGKLRHKIDLNRMKKDEATKKLKQIEQTHNTDRKLTIPHKKRIQLIITQLTDEIEKDTQLYNKILYENMLQPMLSINEIFKNRGYTDNKRWIRTLYNYTNQEDKKLIMNYFESKFKDKIEKEIKEFKEKLKVEKSLWIKLLEIWYGN